jgi:hypothetical protein
MAACWWGHQQEEKYSLLTGYCPLQNAYFKLSSPAECQFVIHFHHVHGFQHGGVKIVPFGIGKHKINITIWRTKHHPFRAIREREASILKFHLLRKAMKQHELFGVKTQHQILVPYIYHPAIGTVAYYRLALLG